MAFTVDYTDLAAADVADARSYYGRMSVELDERFSRELASVLDAIADRPELLATVSRDVRRYRLKSFPYAVYYRVRPPAVQVIAVFHDRRDPNVWQSRA